jgi:hypothetical protein
MRGIYSWYKSKISCRTNTKVRYIAFRGNAVCLTQQKRYQEEGRSLEDKEAAVPR